MWDRLGDDGKKGATASIVIPWFVDYLETRPEMSWKAMAWWIHDHLPYSELQFYHHRCQKFDYAAFNIRWHETKVRGQIVSMSGDRILQKDRREHSPGDHASEYPGFPKLEHPNELYPDPLG